MTTRRSLCRFAGLSVVIATAIALVGACGSTATTEDATTEAASQTSDQTEAPAAPAPGSPAESPTSTTDDAADSQISTEPSQTSESSGTDEVDTTHQTDNDAGVSPNTSLPGVAPEVLDSFRQHGQANVLISLRHTQGDDIAATQSAVLAALSEVDFELGIAFESIPAISGTVRSSEALATLSGHQKVEMVTLDSGGGG